MQCRHARRLDHSTRYQIATTRSQEALRFFESGYASCTSKSVFIRHAPVSLIYCMQEAMEAAESWILIAWIIAKVEILVWQSRWQRAMAKVTLRWLLSRLYNNDMRLIQEAILRLIHGTFWVLFRSPSDATTPVIHTAAQIVHFSSSRVLMEAHQGDKHTCYWNR